MALGDGITWDETLPSDSTLVSAGDDHIKDLRKGTRSRLAREHEFPASQSATNEAGVHKFITLQAQTGEPTLSGTQVAIIYKSSATAEVTIANTSGSSIQITDGTRIRAESGQIIQVVSTNITAVSSTQAAIPFDDTVPQITEGVEIGSLAITPSASGNGIIIMSQFNIDQGSLSGNRKMAISMFLDTTANAVAVQSVPGQGAAWNGLPTHMQYTTIAPSSTACSYSFRAGAADSGAYWYFNALGNATNNFGGVLLSNITIQEVQA